MRGKAALMARVLLIVGGGIAAYKSLELVRLLAKAGHSVTPVLTKGGEHFVTAMSLGALAGSQVHTSLWELKDEVEIGHIQLSRAADFVLVCPATADLLAKMAAGMADDLAIMVTAVVLSVGIMLFSAEPISRFVNRHPTVKVLALSFLLLIGVSLIGDGLGVHVPKGYIYFAMGFSVFVEMINLRVRRRGAPVKLHTPY